jgi:hypothetical protein
MQPIGNKECQWQECETVFDWPESKKWLLESSQWKLEVARWQLYPLSKGKGDRYAFNV